MASILVDDTDPQVQYLPVANWTPFRIAAEDILSFPSNGLISPMYGTLHLANNGESNSAANTSVGFNYIGTHFSAHFRGPLDADMEDVLCLLDGIPQSIQFVSSIFVCSSNSTPEDGQHQLNVTIKTAQVYYFDYLKYTPSMSTPPSEDEDVMFENDNSPVVELLEPGSSSGFLFDGYSISWYTLFDNGSSQVPKDYDMMYVVDDQPPVFFMFSQPILAANPLGEPQLLFQTPGLGHGIHNVTLQWLPPSRENQTNVRIQSYVVQNSTSSIDLGLSAVPISSQPVSSEGDGSSPGKRVGVIIGSTIGGIVAAILLVIVMLSILRHRRRKLTRLSKAGLYFMHRIGPEHISDSVERS